MVSKPVLKLKRQCLQLVTNKTGTGYDFIGSVTDSRMGEKLWRLWIHLVAGRDSLTESAGSQAHHLYFEVMQLIKIAKELNNR